MYDFNCVIMYYLLYKVVNESDESSFGFYGKPSDPQDESVVIRGNKGMMMKQLPNDAFKKQNVKKKSFGFKLDLESMKKNESAAAEQDEKENIEFHKYIMNTLKITQRTLDALQDQIQNDPNQLSPEQLDLIARIHTAQKDYDKKRGILVVDTEENQYNGDDEDYFDVENNILPSDLKEEYS